MAARNPPLFEGQALGSNATGVRDRLKNFWERSREPLAPQDAQSPGGASNGSSSIASGSVTISAFGGFKIEARTLSTGWRVSSTDQATGIQHEFYIHDGAIYHVSLWNQSAQFVVGCRVKRIRESEKRAILQAVSELSS
jgi:hypothetical protein